MTRLTALPPELLLQILSYLPIPSISALQITSKGFHNLITENVETVYREAALVHRLTPSQIDMKLAIENLEGYLARWYSKPSLEDGISWKSFCQRRTNTLRSWAGSGPSTVVRYHPQRLALPPNQFFLDTPNQVHRIKVDELNGFFITTSRTGGLIVSDIDTGKTLWNLPNIYVRRYAHLEYENGYLVFDRPDGVKEVWRSESVKPQEVTQEDSRTDRAQELVAQVMDETFNFVHPADSIKLSPRFVPHALVPIPILTLPGLPPIADHTRAYRMVYPNLLASSTTTAYVWDVCTMQRVQTVDNVMNLKASGAGRNIPEGSYTGRRWWDLLPEAIEGEGWEDTDEEVEAEEEQSLLAQSSAAASAQAGPEIVYPEVEAGAQDVDMDLGSYAAAALDYAQKETVVPTSERSVGTEHPPETNFPAHQPFAVEISDKWVFVVRDEYLTLYKRTSDSGEPFTIEPGQLAFRLPANRERYGRWKARLGAKSVRDHPDSDLVKQEVIWDSQTVENNKKKLWDHLIAVHVSPDQQHLALLTASSRLIFIPFFERVIYRQAKLYDIAIDIQLGSSASASVYLAYGCKSNPRISVVTDTGVFLITPYFTCSLEREVDLTIHRVAPFFLDPDRLELVTCLMMSDTGLWLTWARGAGTDDTQEAERAMYTALLESRWASELQEQMKERAILDVLDEPSSDEDEDEMRSTRSVVEERQRKDIWQKRNDGKYAWESSTDDAKKQAWSLFEWKFIRGLKTPPEIQTRMNGDGQVVVPGNAHAGEEILWVECAEVHQVKFL
ncbi:hypothetical protein BKA70DRAFT_1560335 [Coprinopsis sp. MPI-PUGE-AT-0042]|nr:hypothetical protein BKA70DRAFT_1560335 [Coprinopsis sp. MPI-PUGE-AT-0042]